MYGAHNMINIHPHLHFVSEQHLQLRLRRIEAYNQSGCSLKKGIVLHNLVKKNSNQRVYSCLRSIRI